MSALCWLESVSEVKCQCLPTYPSERTRNIYIYQGARNANNLCSKQYLLEAHVANPACC